MKMIELLVAYADRVREDGHKTLYNIEEIASISEVPCSHPDCPPDIRELLGEDSTVAVILIKNMQGYVQMFTCNRYSDVKEKLQKLGVEILSA